MKKIYQPKTLMFLAKLTGILLIVMFAIMVLYSINQGIIVAELAGFYEGFGFTLGVILVYLIVVIFSLVLLGAVYNYLKNMTRSTN